MRFLDDDVDERAAPRAKGASATATSTAFLLKAIRKHWYLGVPIALAVTLAVTFHTLGQTKIYRSRAVIQFDPTPPKPLGRDVQQVVELGPSMWWNSVEYYQTQFQIIRSTRVARAVVRELGLHKNAHFLANKPRTETLPPRAVPEEAAARILIGRLDVTRIPESHLAAVTYEDADPERTQRVLASVTRVYAQQNLDQVLESTDAAVEWLSEQLEVLKRDLEQSELKLHDYKRNNQILSVSLDDQSNMLREEMHELNRALTAARARREAVAARKVGLDKVNPENPDRLPANELLSSTLVQNLRNRYLEEKRERDAMLASGRGPNHPEVQAANSALALAKQGLQDEIENIKKAVAHDYDAATREVAGLSKLFEQAKEAALKLNLLEIEFNRLQRTKENNEKVYGIVMERTKEGDLTRMLRVNNVAVLEPPTLPKSPVKPNVPLNVAIGLLVGVGLGVALAGLRELGDRSVKTPEDVESEIGVTCLGILPVVPGAQPRARRFWKRARHDLEAAGPSPELAVHELPKSGLSEAARAIRTNLMFMSPDTPFRRLLVTSSAPMEGKTMVASSIAIAMAQAGQKVLLIDGDLRRPRIHKVFGHSNRTGVSTAVLDADSVEQMDLRTEIPNLSVLTSGPVPPNPAELFHSERFHHLLDGLSQRYDRIIVDSPPLVPVTDATILSQNVDGTLMVVHAFRTRKDLLRRAIRTLGDVGGRVVGVVLNSVDLNRAEYGSSYQYYYYRREGYASDDAG